MRYEIKFLDEATSNTVMVEAPDEETALFRAGMRFSELDLIPERIEVVDIRTEFEARFVS